MITKIIHSTQIVLFFLFINNLAAQPDYRITPEGKYQYMEQSAKAFDETKGVYYRNITPRTFFLETQRLELIPGNLLYEDFRAMTTEEQQAILQHFSRLPDCSSNNITSQCLVFNAPARVYNVEQAQVMDMSKKCRRTRYGKDSLTESGKMVVEPGELPKCNESISPTNQ